MHERTPINRGHPMTDHKDMIEACRLVELAHVALIAGNPWQAARFALEAAQKFHSVAIQHLPITDTSNPQSETQTQGE